MSLADRKILLGVSGSIAAYKSALLVRSLREQGAEVQVIMTESAQHFITPLTMQSLSGKPVATDAFDGAGESGMKHIDLARWADIFLVAPATANVLAKFANGIADDLLSMVYLASDKPCALAPAMNLQMWQHPSTNENVKKLDEHGVTFLGPDEGDQACGENGAGRMMEPAGIIDILPAVLADGLVVRRKIVITAGPTVEPLDPIRYISNRSSGKMGFALADAAARLGSEVVLIAGPVALDTPAGVRRIDVRTAAEMSRAASKFARKADIFIGCAAVSDYRATQVANKKIKRQQDRIQLELTANTDMIKKISNSAGAPFTVGFAAETEQLEKNAKAKLLEKGLDMICANLVTNDGRIVFDSDFNAMTVYWRGGQQDFPMETKYLLARQLIRLIEDQFLLHQERKDERSKANNSA